MEVVSDKNRPHDIKKKRIEYAKAGIPEYWIVDPKKETITVLVLKGRSKTYTELGTFRKGQRRVVEIAAGIQRRRDGSFLTRALIGAGRSRRVRRRRHALLSS